MDGVLVTGFSSQNIQEHGLEGLRGLWRGLHRVEAKLLHQTRAFHTVFPHDGLEQRGSLSYVFSGAWGPAVSLLRPGTGSHR